MSANNTGLYGLTVAYIMKELGFHVWLDSLSEKVFVIDYRSFSLIVEGRYCIYTKKFLFDFYKLSYDFKAGNSQALKIYVEQEVFIHVLVKITNHLLYFMEKGVLPFRKKIQENALKYSNRVRW